MIQSEKGGQRVKTSTGGLYLSLNMPPSFPSPFCISSLSLLFLKPELFHNPATLPPATSTPTTTIFSPSVSIRHVFQGLPSIDTVSTNSSPPASRGEPPREGGEPVGGPLGGKACGVCGDMCIRRRSRALLIAAGSGNGQKKCSSSRS